MMTKLKLTCFCVFALLFGFLGSFQVFAATEDNTQVKLSEFHGPRHFKHNPEFIKKQAELLGIETDGKDTETISKEVRELIIKKRAEELGIDIKGKHLDSLAKEVRETIIKKEAKELGISTDNKDFHGLAQEVREKRIFQAAEKLGLETKNKSANELFKEIMTNHSDKAKELKLFPHKEEKIFFFHRSKEN
jgi:hypothetical protein